MRRFHPVRATGRRDSGVSLLEVLIAITLIGVAVTSIIVAVQVTATASGIDEDHANSFSWLQAASDEIYRIPRLSCATNTPDAIRTAYSAAIQTPNVPKPDAWPNATAASIQVTGIQFLGKASPDDDYEWGDTYCLEGGVYANAPQYTQRITIRAISPKGLVKTLQMVKGNS